MTKCSAGLAFLSFGAIGLFGAAFWEAKQPDQWSSEEIQKILTDSPWAKQITSSTESNAGRRGGGGGRGGRLGGGFPGGGGYPGGGGGYPGQGRRGPTGGGGQEPIKAILRWETALPVQQAQRRFGNNTTSTAAVQAAPETAAPTADDRQYILTLVGLRLPAGRNADGDGRDDSDPRDSDSPRQRRGRDPDSMRRQFLESTRILRKGKSALTPRDVKLDPDSETVRFFFRADDPISLDDKEVTFESQMGRAKLEKKFKLKEMVYRGKLEL